MFSTTAAGRFLSAIHKMASNPRKSSRSSSLRSMSSGSTASSASLRTPTDYGARPISPKSRNVRFAEPPALRIDTVNIPYAVKQLDALLTPPEERTFAQAELIPKSRPLPPLPGARRMAASVPARLPAGMTLRDVPVRLHMALLADEERVVEHYENLERQGR